MCPSRVEKGMWSRGVVGAVLVGGLLADRGVVRVVVAGCGSLGESGGWAEIDEGRC